MTTQRLLIIDDDIELCAELTEALENEGYSVDSVLEAVKGEELIRSGKYDIILLDYKMPILGGNDILKKLKTDHVKKRVFLLTGKSLIEQTLQEENLSDAVNGIIKKPINFKDLLEKIKTP